MRVSGAGLSAERRRLGYTGVLTGLPPLTLILLALRDQLTLGSTLLIYLLSVVAVAVVGGLRPALTAAVAAFLLANFFFTPPYGTLWVDSRDAAVALTVFVVVAALVAVTVDVSAGHRVAAARSQAQARLLAQRAQRLAEIDSVRAALLAAVGHDLRTPLAGIKAAVSSLRQRDLVWSPDDERALLETIETGADRLDRLIANLLALSRLQAGVVSVALQPVALDEVVGRALLDEPAPPPDDPPVLLDVPEDLPLVLADPGLLERVVANLVGNARHFAPAGTRVEVRAQAPGSAGPAGSAGRAGSAGSAGPAGAQLMVIDHGPGVPSQAWDEIFLPFQRLGDTRASGGVGLGLAIVRGFTEAMGGTVHPERTPGGGLTMVVTLPLAGAADPATGAPDPATGAPDPATGAPDPCHRRAAMTRVLIVEDEPALRRALGINLAARGYEVEAVGTGEAALRAAAATPPDLVILDLGLPDLDGEDVVRGLRGWSRVPIIVLSARDGQRDKVGSLDAGADDYLTKPFGMDELLARLRAALRRAEPSDQVVSPVVSTPHFTVDLAARRVTTPDGEVRLTPTEWHLLEILVRHPGKLIEQRQLLHDVWGPQYGTETNYLRVYMAQLRRKLEPAPSSPRYLITEPGLGYRFEP